MSLQDISVYWRKQSWGGTRTLSVASSASASLPSQQFLCPWLPSPTLGTGRRCDAYTPESYCGSGRQREMKTTLARSQAEFYMSVSCWNYLRCVYKSFTTLSWFWTIWSMIFNMSELSLYPCGGSGPAWAHANIELLQLVWPHVADSVTSPKT